MRIALDYDNTYTKDPPFWDMFIVDAIGSGHEIRIVTARCPRKDNIDHVINGTDVIYCDGIAKRFYCKWLADDKKGWLPDIWIDDKPEGVDNNSTATEEILATWRESDEYKATTPLKG